MYRFLAVVLAVTAVTQVPVALGVAEAARLLGWPRPHTVGAVWALAGMVFFVARARVAVPDRKPRTSLGAWIDLPYFIHWCAALWALVPCVVATVVFAPLYALLRAAPIALPTQAYLWSYASGLVVCAYGVLVRRRWVRVVERPVVVEGLDQRLDGLRIAHLSDLHIGSLTPRAWGMSWSRAANDARPDLTVVTGDLVTSGNDYHDDVADVLGALRAPMGVIASMGNHDYFGDGERLARKLEDRGVTVLRNAGMALHKDGSCLWLCAIDDTWTRRDDLTKALAGRPDGALSALLAHDPATFDAAAEAGAQVVLSGHTHGGQIAVPFAARALNLAKLVYRYPLGIYRRGRAVLYVHPGLGTTGPPIRLGVAPEVSVLVLRAG